MDSNDPKLISGPDIIREDSKIISARRIIRTDTVFVVRWSTQRAGYLSDDWGRSFATPLEAGEFAQGLWSGRS